MAREAVVNCIDHIAAAQRWGLVMSFGGEPIPDPNPPGNGGVSSKDQKEAQE